MRCLSALVFATTFLLVMEVCLGMSVNIQSPKIWFEDETTHMRRSANPLETDGLPGPLKSNAGLGSLALKMQSVLDHGKENTLFAPLSVSVILGLVLLAARGATFNEVATLLGYTPPFNPEMMLQNQQSLSNLFKGLEESNSTDMVIAMANGVFVQNNFQINPDYVTNASSLYHANVFNVDFITQNQETMKFINKWVFNSTEGHINNLISEPVSHDTKVIIVNAIYFNGAWEKPFLREMTRKQKFYISPTESVFVDMMANGEEVLIHFDREKKVLGLPYKDNKTVMYFILPSGNLSEYIKTLTPQSLLEAVHQTKRKMAIYTVPRMKLEKTVSLHDALLSLGVTTLFASSEADLSGLSPSVHVSNVVHKVQVEVNEEGTTASAATAIDLVRTGPPTIRLDRPFLFFIHHTPANIISFWGTVYNPLAS